MICETKDCPDCGGPGTAIQQALLSSAIEKLIFLEEKVNNDFPAYRYWEFTEIRELLFRLEQEL